VCVTRFPPPISRPCCTNRPRPPTSQYTTSISKHYTNYDQLEYRLRTCGELCSGLFTSAYPTSSGSLGDILKVRKFSSIDSSDSDRKRILLGHIIATKSSSDLVTDDAMDYPKDWQTKYQMTPSIGHNEEGETVCIHSLCVHPDFARKGFGHMLLNSYVQRIEDSGVAKRIALICRDRLVKFYENAGFEKQGPSKCQYGGGNWVDMVRVIEDKSKGNPSF
jgi:ribosomal protein S18 acetylase RimI-like enzyme